MTARHPGSARHSRGTMKPVSGMTCRTRMSRLSRRYSYRMARSLGFLSDVFTAQRGTLRRQRVHCGKHALQRCSRNRSFALVTHGSQMSRRSASGMRSHREPGQRGSVNRNGNHYRLGDLDRRGACRRFKYYLRTHDHHGVRYVLRDNRAYDRIRGMER